MPSDEAFRQQVISVANDLFPEATIEPHPDSVELLVVDGHQVSLQNIWANHRLSDAPDDDLEALVKHHLGQILGKQLPSIEDVELEDVREKLFPQIMPVEYATSAPLPLIHFPLSTHVSVGLVADFPETYMYLRNLELQRWDIAADDLHALALSNLEKESQSMALQSAGEGRNQFIAIASGDGYDAARILVPSIQAFLASHLGETFRFAIPNRDFLITWRLDCDDHFHEQLAAQIANDSHERPYPLSSSIFVRNSEGNIHEQSNG